MRGKSLVSVPILVALLFSTGRGAETPHVLIHEALAGINGDSRVQCVALRFQAAEDGRWGPGPGETAGRCLLVFEDASGRETGRYVFAADAPLGTPDALGYHSVLAATREFADYPGAPVPDFILPAPWIAPGGGKITFQANPANPAYAIRLSLSHGNYAGDTGADTADPPNPAGPPAPPLPITGVQSLKRFRNLDPAHFGAGQRNDDFRLEAPEARNSAGKTAALASASLAEQGRTLFFRETFGGNGRTCGTCHLEGAAFSLPPEMVRLLDGTSPGPVDPLPADDPLFVFERSPALAGLEHAAQLRGGRALILENVDGFDRPPVFRASPPLLNLKLTGPFGLSGETAGLKDFNVTAVKQHFPRTLARNADPAAGPLDFRLPAAAEGEALEAFLFSLTTSTDLDLLLASAVRRGVDAALLRRGRDLFFGAARCFRCHNGPALADVDPSLVAEGHVPAGGNRSFNTGVARFSEERGLPGPHETGREFSTRSLLGVARRTAFFHDNSAHGLEEAVRFYCTGCDENPFTRSPAFAFIGSIALEEEPILAFLRALDLPHPDCAGGTDCDRNGIDDSCELAIFSERDCDRNGTPDTCEGDTIDCDRNRIADACDIAADPGLDCNRNGALDRCDIESRLSPDCNGDSIPDECEPGTRLDLADHLPAQGFSLEGKVPDQFTGGTVSAAGDVNADGVDDFLIGSLREVHLIFGKRGATPTGAVDLSQLDGTRGFTFRGLPDNFRSRVVRVAPAGDVNGDGVADVILGDTDGTREVFGSGSAVVLLGRPGIGAGGVSPPLDGRSGFLILGATQSDYAGHGVSSAGDLNGDGFDDLLIGSPYADSAGNASGAVDVVFGGKTVGAGGVIRLPLLDGKNGFRIDEGTFPGLPTQLGSSVAPAGDVNGDGRADVLLGARASSPFGREAAGEALVVFGGPGIGSSGRLALSDLDGSNGYRILGSDPSQSFVDMSLAPAGDLNGDGHGDILFGRQRIHVLFGGPEVGRQGIIDLDSLGPADGLVIEEVVGASSDPATALGAGVGDVNGDGWDDLAVASSVGTEVHLLFGGPHLARGGVVKLSSLDASKRVTIRAPGVGYFQGLAASRAGDVNGDGLRDLLVGTPVALDADGRQVGRAYALFGPTYPADCNRNGVPDECEIASGSAPDRNGNGVPDSCEIDPEALRRFRRGDVNADGALDITDPVNVLLFLFAGSEAIPCRDGADADNNGELEISDPIELLAHLFLGGPPPAPPHLTCGPDTGLDALDCESFPPCAAPR